MKTKLKTPVVGCGNMLAALAYCNIEDFELVGLVLRHQKVGNNWFNRTLLKAINYNNSYIPSWILKSGSGKENFKKIQ